MLSSHKGMNVSQGEFVHATDDIMKVLKKISTNKRKVGSAIGDSFKSNIVGVQKVCKKGGNHLLFSCHFFSSF